MADDPLLLQDDDYNSASDEEFDPTAAAAAAADDDDALSSSSEDDDAAAAAATTTTTKSRRTKGKRKRADAGDVELDSGDEATIAANKKQRQGALSDEDDEGGEGGLVKTRAQRRLERKERRPLARVDGATADVDAIWAALSAEPVGRRPPAAKTTAAEEEDEKKKKKKKKKKKDDSDGEHGARKRGVPLLLQQQEEEPLPEEEMITIKRTYDFAGDRITEERQVPKSSAEARLYLTQQQDKQAAAVGGKKAQDVVAEGDKAPVEDEEEREKEDADKSAIRRPLRRASRFDPNPTAEVRGLPLEKQLTWARRRALLDPSVAAAATAAAVPLPAAPPADAAQTANAVAFAAKKGREKAQKLNTVDKSRLDWAGYVDKEGIAEELDEYGRAKEGYLGRMDFLERVDQRREEERRAAKAALKT